jgi:hypothetical protein
MLPRPHSDLEGSGNADARDVDVPAPPDADHMARIFSAVF